jgi:hypothetical protein
MSLMPSALSDYALGGHTQATLALIA